MEKKNLFEQAKEMIHSLTEHQGTADDAEREATRQAISAAHQEANPEEIAQLKQLEQELKEQDLLH